MSGTNQDQPDDGDDQGQTPPAPDQSERYKRFVWEPGDLVVRDKDGNILPTGPDIGPNQGLIDQPQTGQTDEDDDEKET